MSFFVDKDGVIRPMSEHPARKAAEVEAVAEKTATDDAKVKPKTKARQ